MKCMFSYIIRIETAKLTEEASKIQEMEQVFLWKMIQRFKRTLDRIDDENSG